MPLWNKKSNLVLNVINKFYKNNINNFYLLFGLYDVPNKAWVQTDKIIEHFCILRVGCVSC